MNVLAGVSFKNLLSRGGGFEAPSKLRITTRAWGLWIFQPPEREEKLAKDLSPWSI